MIFFAFILLFFLFSGETRLSFVCLVFFCFRYRSSVAKSAGARQHSTREGVTLPFSGVMF
jgi:hypothetical protein